MPPLTLMGSSSDPNLEVSVAGRVGQLRCPGVVRYDQRPWLSGVWTAGAIVREVCTYMSIIDWLNIDIIWQLANELGVMSAVGNELVARAFRTVVQGRRFSSSCPRQCYPPSFLYKSLSSLLLTLADLL